MNQQEAMFEKELPPIFVHGDLDDYGLDPYEFRVYGHLARRGSQSAIYASNARMAADCDISERKLRQCLAVLLGLRLICVYEKRGGSTTVYRLTPKSEWLKIPKHELRELRKQVVSSKQTHQKLDEPRHHMPTPTSAPHAEGSAPHAEGSAPHAEGSAPHADKVNPFKYLPLSISSEVAVSPPNETSLAPPEKPTAATKKIWEEKIKTALRFAWAELTLEHPNFEKLFCELSEERKADAFRRAQGRVRYSQKTFSTCLIQELLEVCNVARLQKKDFPAAPKNQAPPEKAPTALEQERDVQAEQAFEVVLENALDTGAKLEQALHTASAAYHERYEEFSEGKRLNVEATYVRNERIEVLKARARASPQGEVK